MNLSTWKIVQKTVPEIAHKIDPEIPLEIVYLIAPEKVPNMLEYSIAILRHLYNIDADEDMLGQK